MHYFVKYTCSKKHQHMPQNFNEQDLAMKHWVQFATHNRTLHYASTKIQANARWVSETLWLPETHSPWPKPCIGNKVMLVVSHGLHNFCSASRWRHLANLNHTFGYTWHLIKPALTARLHFIRTELNIHIRGMGKYVQYIGATEPSWTELFRNGTS